MTGKLIDPVFNLGWKSGSPYQSFGLIPAPFAYFSYFGKKIK
jgi:hypothetical protein